MLSEFIESCNKKKMLTKYTIICLFQISVVLSTPNSRITKIFKCLFFLLESSYSDKKRNTKTYEMIGLISKIIQLDPKSINKIILVDCEMFC